MPEPIYNGALPEQRLVGGQRFNVTVERDPPLLMMSRVDTVGEAWDNVGKSRYFYVIFPTRAAVAAGDQKVGTFSIRARLAESTNLPVAVGAAIRDLQSKLGFMRVRRVDAVDVVKATSVETQAGQTGDEKLAGAGQTTVQKLVGTAKDVGSVAQKATAQAFGLVKLTVAVAVATGLFIIWREVKK